MNTNPTTDNNEPQESFVDRGIARREFDPAEIDDAKSLFLEHGPAKCSLIVQEMRRRGWLSFVLSELAGSDNKNMSGLIAGLKWDSERLNQAREPINEANEQLNSPKTTLKTKSRLRRLSFKGWLKKTTPKWNWDWKYQNLIYRHLDRITRKESTRLMIFLPPRHGKSELVTIRYAAWRLENEPQTRIIIGGYNQKLSNRFSRNVRRIVGNECELSIERNAADEWETQSGGGLCAIGVGAGITGFGADLIIVDDPIRGRADAESSNNRDRIGEWFNDDLHTRLEPGGSIILIQTRWHEDDLAGRLKKDMNEGGEQWDIISLPALAEENDPLTRPEGAALCRARFDETALLKKKRQLGSYSFNSLYQQRPVPPGGAAFKREWFTRIVDHAPEGLRWCRGYDLAVSTKTSADFTASFRCALDRKTGDLYIADGFRKRIEFPDQRRYIVERIREERNTEHGIEEALHGQAFVQELWRETSLSRFAFRGVRVSGDKLTRSLSWANRAEAGKVVLVRGPWIDEFIEEVCQFPNAKHDDQVDAVSLAVNMIETRKYAAFGC